MLTEFSKLIGWIAAIGIGLLIGVERERHKGRGPDRKQAGLRSFILASVAGAISTQLGSAAFIVSAAAVSGFAVISYWRTRSADPGITTEIALLSTFLLGALSMRDAAFAAGLGVFVALALAGKVPLHRFVRRVLSTQELNDGLLLAAAVLIVLPLLPDQPVAVLGGLNLRTLWLLAVLVMGIQTVGHIALRLFGPTRGLLLTGFAGGFISSVATIGAMGQRARSDPAHWTLSLAGALMSNISTPVQLALLVGILMPGLLLHLAPSLVLAGLAASAGAAWAYFFGRHGHDASSVAAGSENRLFNPRGAVIFAALVGAILWSADMTRRLIGTKAVVITAGLAGFADAHAAATSVAQLTAHGALSMSTALAAILCAFSSNALSKIIVAFATGGQRFGLPFAVVITGMVAVAWAGLWWPNL